MKPITVSVDDAKQRLELLLDTLPAAKHGVIIADQSGEVAVLLSVERYRWMMDMLEDWEDEHDAELASMVREARADHARGEGRDFESFVAELEA